MPNVVVRQGSTTSDGFLSSTEYSLWASTMRLEEDEAHPTLKQSRFMSLPSDLPPQVYSILLSLLSRSDKYQTIEDDLNEDKVVVSPF